MYVGNTNEHSQEGLMFTSGHKKIINDQTTNHALSALGAIRFHTHKFNWNSNDIHLSQKIFTRLSHWSKIFLI